MSTRRRQKAFSLIEMIVVVTIIGLMAGAALPIIDSFSSEAEHARGLSNAQRIAHTHSVALRAGHDFAEGETAIEDVVLNIIHGTTVQMTAGGDHVFVGIPTIPEDLRTEAIQFLEFQNGSIIYKPNN